jgi:radical SAM superfamily enzyme YgiQ (UPF0313 family)
MHYEGDIYRPPSEAYSLIIQVTIGCTHNRCAFCSSFKEKRFRLKPFETVLADLQEARRYYKHVERVFFADGDAFCMTTDKIIRLLEAVREIFPECKRVGTYSRASQILRKSDEELIKLREMGLGIVYIGAESGSDEVLRRIDKGETVQEIVEAVRKAEKNGIKTSVTFISGLGGRELMKEHAVKTGEAIAAMGASYVGFLTLLLEPEAPLYALERSGAFELLTPPEVMEELEIILENTNCTEETVFRSNHASNWLTLKGDLPRDKERMLEQVRHAKANAGMFKPAMLRRL